MNLPSSVIALSYLEINNAAGITLNSSPTISSGLTLTRGKITTGANQINLGTAASVTGASSASYVNGTVQKAFNTSSGSSFTFPVGDASSYTPVALANMAVGTAGTLTAKTTAGQHPQIAGSGINSAKDVARYWTLTASGLVASTYNVVCTFVSTDVIGAADWNKFVVRRYNASAWSSTTAGTRNTTSTKATGLASFGDLAVGEYLVSAANSMISASPSTLAADGSTKTTITVTAKDANNNVISGIAAVNVFVAATGSGNTLAQPTTPTDANGQTTATLKSTKAETKTVSVTINGTAVAQTASVTFTGPVSASVSTVGAAPTSVTADGSSTSTITVTLKDANGNPVSGKMVTLASSRGATDTISAASGSSSSSGVVTFTVTSTTVGSATFTATDSTDSRQITQRATVSFIHCADGDVTADPWTIDGNNRIVITLCDSYGLGSVQALRLTNCTMTAQAYDATDSVLGSAVSLTDPDHGGGYVPLPAGTVKVVCLASLISGYTTGSCNAQAQDMCGLFSATADPVMTRLTIAGGGETQQILTGILSAERLLRVQNGTPGLTRLTVVVNGCGYVLAPLSDGASLSLDVGAAMIPGDGNTVVLLGEGAEGASATITWVILPWATR